jgi:two-component system, sensor histidine kinase FlrB
MEALTQELPTRSVPRDPLAVRVAALTSELKATRLARLRDLEERERLAERHAALLAALPGGVVVLDADGVVRDCNPAAGALLGEPLLGEAWSAVLGRVTTAAHAYGGELALRSGRRVSIARRELEGATLLLVSDVTEAHLVRALHERQDRLASLGRMAAQLAHQVRTPLAAAMLYASHLTADLAPQDRADAARKLQGRLHHLEGMVGELLAFARGDQAALVPVEVASVLEDAALDLAGRLASGGRLTIRTRTPGLAVRAHRGALTGAVVNLVVNALDLIGPAAEVLVEAEAVDGPEGPRALLHVADNGPGVRADLRRRVFEPFFTTRASGTGLGLAVVQSVARALGGEARLAEVACPAPHTGAHFVIDLPALPVGKQEAA